MFRPTTTPQVLGVALATALFACGLGLTAALTGPPAGDAAVVEAGQAAIQPDASSCMPEGETGEGICAEQASGAGCEAAVADETAMEPDGKKPPRAGWCRCGCGIRCDTSADCGGAPCDIFITCC